MHWEACKRNTKVCISPTSGYFKEQGMHGIGTLQDDAEYEDDNNMRVTFPDGYHNTYSPEDLMPATIQP